MSKMAENMEWENEAPQLAKLKKSNPFTVPTNYFEELEERINQSVFMSSLEKSASNGFTTPPEYFETLSNQIISQAKLSTMVSEPQGFSIPDGYFEQLQQNIAAKTTNTKKTVKLWHQPLFKYAVAACLVIMSTTGWFANKQYQSHQLRKTELAKEQLLYDIDESVIIEYVQEAQQGKTGNVTDSEMENYILDNFSTTDLSNNL
ncbi:hypothetical protein [Pedobacter sp.]|uniref:hypothetical protein n=1 Tax=Pedobacter sp. TaxID=1411316 RepID=UPI0031D40934